MNIKTKRSLFGRQTYHAPTKPVVDAVIVAFSLSSPFLQQSKTKPRSGRNAGESTKIKHKGGDIISVNKVQARGEHAAAPLYQHRPLACRTAPRNV